MSQGGSGFDEKVLIEDLKIWWEDQVGGGADDPFAEPKPPSGTIFDVLPAIDSLGVVTGLITIEKHLGFKVPVRVIRRGGYKDFDDLITDLLPKLGALVEKQKEKHVKGAKKEAA